MAEGWTFYRQQGLGIAAHHREVDGRQAIFELVVLGDRLGAADLRAIPWARLEAKAAADPAPFEHYFEEHPEVERQPPVLTLDNVRDTLALLADADTEEPAPSGRAPLRRPSSNPYPPAFYEAVAAAYREYVTSDPRAPAARVAEEAGVPVRTVHTWIQQARRRGFLPKGRRGKVG